MHIYLFYCYHNQNLSILYIFEKGIKHSWPPRDGLVIRVSASHAVGRGFESWLGHTKDQHKNGTTCHPTWHAGVIVGV